MKAVYIERGRKGERDKERENLVSLQSRDFKGIGIIIITQLFPSLKKAINMFYVPHFKSTKCSMHF